MNIMNIINILSLNPCEKVKLKNLFLESNPIEIEYIQHKIYIILMNSKIIILNNSNHEIYLLLKKIQEDNYIKKKESKSIPAEFWTKEDEEYIQENFFLKTLLELSLKFNKSFYQILLKARELNLINKKKWDSNEIKYLENNIETSNYELAKELKRSIHSIKSKKRMIKNKKSIFVEREICF